MAERSADWVWLRTEQLSAAIDPLGAQLSALRDGQGRDLLWNGDPTFWTGRAPLLFPIVGALAHGRYRLGRDIFAMPKHGFARHSQFAVVETAADEVRLRLSANAETLARYPFEFELDLRFALSNATLSISAIVCNNGKAPMPASFGFHPALRWPLPYGDARADHVITFEQPEPQPIRRIDADGLLKPKPEVSPVRGASLPLSDALFENDVVIFERLHSSALCYGAATGGLKFEFPDTPYLGVWTKPQAPFICIEPWHGLADPEGYDGQFFDKPGVFVIPPQARSAAMTMSITVLGA